jgi:16S rRNA (guanine966-N2)-methyltransferase
LGFEALSRGAERAYFVEKARSAAAAIRKNAASLGVESRIMLIESDVSRAGRALEREAPFDLIVADPPWTALEASERAIQAILSPELLSPDGVLILGHPKGRPIVPSSLSAYHIDKSRSWGDSAATFFRRVEP